MRLGEFDYFLTMAKLVSLRGTCARRQVGCILVDKDRHILATGYNGVPKGVRHCIDVPCPGLKHAGDPTKLDECEAIHAEQNAILQCKDVREIFYCFVTVSPCTSCVKLLQNTNCKSIIFSEEYKDTNARRLWKGGWVANGPIKHVFAGI